MPSTLVLSTKYRPAALGNYSAFLKKKHQIFTIVHFVGQIATNSK